MARNGSPKVTPAEIAKQYGWSLDEVHHFAARLLEEANDHWAAHAMWAMMGGNPELASEFLFLAYNVQEAGELTPALRKQSYVLMDELKTLGVELPDIGEYTKEL